MRTRSLHSLFAVVVLATLSACSPKIGDSCRNSNECAPQVGGRTCDLSFLITEDGKSNLGECTIEDCTRGDCPEDEDAICVVVYSTEFLSVACDPEREDIAPMCDPDETCLSERVCSRSQRPCDPDDPLAIADACAPQQICLREGLCADEISSRSSCRRECDSDRDCRPQYRCQQTDINGVYVAPHADDPTAVEITSICVPDH